VREADTVPHDIFRRLLRGELEDLEHAATRQSQPPDLALRLLGVDAKEGAHPFRRAASDADKAGTEIVGVKLNESVEVGHRDAGVTERSCLHAYLPSSP